MIESPNNQEKTIFYLEILEKEILRLNKEIEKLKNEEIDEPVSADDFASVQQDRVRQEELIHNAQERLTEVERALAWAKEHGFVCAICQGEIESARLEADPASITCKEHRDKEDEIN